MKKILLVLSLSLLFVGCSSNKSAAYNKVEVTQSESKALSHLSNLKGATKSDANANVQSVNGKVSLKAAIFK